MAKTTRNTGKRATAAGRGELRARKAAVAKTHDAKLRKLKPARPAPRKGKPSLPPETASLKRQLKTARLQQQASAEILRAVANASGDVARPLQQIAETTARLFGAPSVSIQLAEGGEFTREYRVGAIAQRIGSAYPRSNIRVGGRNLPGTVVFENWQIHIPDLDRLDPSMSDFPGLPHARAGGARTVCGTPLRCEGKAIGALIIFRNRLLPFTDDELALQQSFADQAVIAIENARLFNETKEALARQTATSDILRVISQSPTDVQPVFDAIVLTARGLLGREMAGILRCDDTNFWPAAIAGPEGLSPILNPAPMAINPDANFLSRAIVSKKNLHFPDWSTIDLPEYERNIRDMYGVNSTLYLPLLRYEECIGVLLLAGSQPGMFGENEIALAESFRDQALIAIENARLFNETKEALERQTATADVLRIISRSVAHAAPVFDTILESCQRLFNPYDAAVYLVEGDRVRGVARRGPGAGDWGADSMPLEGSSTGVAIAQGQPVHFPDLADKADLPEDKRAVLKETGGMTVLYAPMISQDSGVGSLVVTRRPKKPFAETEIDFIQSFADQAVIAIENARLFDEVEAKTRDLSEALEQQTATSEVLAVISRSPSDLNPVLEAISDTAARLCGSEQTMFFRYDGTVFRILASWNFPPEVHEMLERRPLMPGHPSAIGRAGASLKPVCIPDVLADPDYGLTGEQNRARYRATLAVPLLREGRLVGALSLNRSEPGAFTEKQIELVATFADQAVIAIENTRLFNETKEALEQQKASADILSVISSSVADTRPVFDKILSSIEHLFGADERLVLLAGEDDLLHIGAVHGPNSERAHALFPVPLQGSASEVAIRERRLVTHANVFDDPDVPPVLRETARRFGKNYSMAVAPLVWEDRAIGSIFVARTSMKAFDGKECALLCTFADQAVIAIQNARLFNETREALERQTATADILKVIASSPSDVQPVFEAIAASAKKLIGGFSAVVQRFIGDDIHLAAFTPTNLEADATLQASFPTPISQFPVFFQVRDGKTLEFTDTEAEDVPRLNRDLARLRGYRSMLFTPLMNNGAPIGMISVTRKEPGSFADHHVQLVRTFADQAVIAIENVRLFDEVKAKTVDLSESLQQQIATADVLKVISRSAFDLQAVLTTLVRSALNLCNAPIGTFFLREGDVLRLATQVGCTPELVQYFHDNPIPLNQSSGAGRAFSTGRVVHFPDVLADPDYRLSEVQRLGDYRSLLAVPLLREQETIGVFSLSRTRPEPFSQRQIDLVTTFADQAVIAIENARLFDEVQAKTRDLTEALTYQTGSGNILKAIASSPTDVGPVLAAIAENAAELCDAYDAAVLLKVGDDLHFSAHHGSIPIGLERWPINRNWTAGRAFLDQKPVHIHDQRAD